MELNIDICHKKIVENIEPKLSFDNYIDYTIWEKKIKKAFKKVIGNLPTKKCDLNINIEYTINKGNYSEIKLFYNSEDNYIVPAYLLIPNNIKGKIPVAICLQGHSTGYHNSVGIPIYEKDETFINKNGAFGIQAVNNGFCAFCIEQRGLGLKKSPTTLNCDYVAHTALLIGRTITGERVYDVSRGIDVIETFKALDSSKIVIIGNSAGGTTAYYSACFDKRIKLAVPSCAVCSYKYSIGSVYHCSCNYLPSALNWFDMGELACLIAPRKLEIFAGINDEIFPIEGVKKVYKTIEGVKKVYKTIEEIYKKKNASKNCNLHITNYAHYFDNENIWGIINNLKKYI